jgi:hypothetical protein
MKIQNKQKPSLIFYGGSHSKRMVRWAKASTELTQKYTIIDLSKPGARIHTNIIPNFSNWSKSDIVLIQIFGNSVFERRAVETERKGNQKIFHLASFCPIHPDVLQQEYQSLLQATKNAKCKIYMLTNVVRHVNCCKKHKNNLKSIVPHQQKVNKEMIEFFNKQGNITILDHHNFLGISKRNLRHNYKYSLLLPDKVHFRDELYEVLLKNLVKHLKI